MNSMKDFPNNPFATSSLNEEAEEEEEEEEVRHRACSEKLNRQGFLVAEPEQDEETLELVDEYGFPVQPDPIELDHIFERVERVRSNTITDFASEQFSASFSDAGDLVDTMEEGNNDDVVKGQADDYVESRSSFKEGSVSKNIEDIDKKEHTDVKLNRASVTEVFQFGHGPKKWCGLLLGLLCAAISGCVYPVMAFVLSNTFQVLSAPTSDQFREDIKEMAFMFMILGVVGAVSVTTQVTLLETAAEEVRLHSLCSL